MGIAVHGICEIINVTELRNMTARISAGEHVARVFVRHGRCEVGSGRIDPLADSSEVAARAGDSDMLRNPRSGGGNRLVVLKRLLRFLSTTAIKNSDCRRHRTDPIS